MAQTLLLGLGGTGSRIIHHVAVKLKQNNIAINDGRICCAVLDTDENDRKKLAQTGVSIPIVATSKDKLIREYISDYEKRGVGVRDWMPYSPDLGSQSMTNGASQIRTKSRLAFMDTVEDKTIRRLETIIDQMFNIRDGQIRVMIASSLSGGTGSGMFIQTALWVRQYFERRNCKDIKIKGILLLPDIFVNNSRDISRDRHETQRLYANAYAAVREMNAIDSILQNKAAGRSLLFPIKLDNLFDSTTDREKGRPIFDDAFLLDAVSEDGSVLTSIESYEQVAARLIYMQMFAPMTDDVHTKTDNDTTQKINSDEPVFGSCGTAQAIYPMDDVLDYCAMRAAQDAISTGWRRIDDEIKIKQRKEAEKERSSEILSHRIDPKQEYIRLFDAKTQKSEQKTGKDRLFADIKHDIHNEQLTKDAGKVRTDYTDKVEDFVGTGEEDGVLGAYIAAKVDKKNPGNLRGLELEESWMTDDQYQEKEDMETLITNTEEAVNLALQEIDRSADEIVEEILNEICPTDMGDINPNDTASILGFLTKKDSDQKPYFVHPIAVRYLLYKLKAKLQEVEKAKAAESFDTKTSAASGYDETFKANEWDDSRTGSVENGPKEYLNTKVLFRSEKKHIESFKEKYNRYNKNQYLLCRKYAIGLVTQKVAGALQERLEKLIVGVEEFFAKLTDTSDKLKNQIANNINKNEKIEQKLIYVYASEGEKEELYQSFNLVNNAEQNRNTEINGIIARALYGQFCVSENEIAENNKPYAGSNIEEVFRKKIVESYRAGILKTKKGDIDLNIYDAIRKSSDFMYRKNGVASTENDEKTTRHQDAFEGILKNLLRMSSPLLMHKSDGKSRTFWGFNPVIAEVIKSPKDRNWEATYNISESMQNEAYAKNELDCYLNVSCIAASDIDKLNEVNDGEYYRSYRQIVSEMVANTTPGNENALVNTPHLDKTWHRILPYITGEKRKEENEKFYRRFWLAFAYGKLRVDAEGNYEVARMIKLETGATSEKFESLLYDGKPIARPDVYDLLLALRVDAAFLPDTEALETKFAKECAELDNYVDTEFLHGKVIRESRRGADGKVTQTTIGGLASKQDNNAVTVIVRYRNCPESDANVAASMVDSLQELCRSLAANKYRRTEQKKIDMKKYALCKRIYDASAMRDKNIDVFRDWVEKWSSKDFSE